MEENKKEVQATASGKCSKCCTVEDRNCCSHKTKERTEKRGRTERTTLKSNKPEYAVPLEPTTPAFSFYRNSGILPVSLLTFFFGPQTAMPKYCKLLSGT